MFAYGGLELMYNTSEHWLEYRKQHDAINDQIAKLKASQAALMQTTIEKLAIFKVGDLVDVLPNETGKQAYTGLYVAEVRLERFDATGIAYALQRPNKNGSKPKIGKYIYYSLSQSRVAKHQET